MEEPPSSQTEEAGNDASVMATNDDAFESKVAAMEAGYFEDKYLTSMKDMFMANDKTHAQFLDTSAFAATPNTDGNATTPQFRRQPVINRGTFARIAIKECAVRAFLTLAGKNADTDDRLQIVSLGAGFDTFPFKLLEETHASPVDYVEVDLRRVVEDKRQLLCDGFLNSELVHADSKPFFRMEGGCSYMRVHAQNATSHPSTYTLAECDLRDTDRLRRALRRWARLTPRMPTLVLAEISLVYMHAEESDAVLRSLSEYLSGARVFVNMEQLGRGDAFGCQMDRNIAARGCPLYGMRSYPDLVSQERRFQACGWMSSCRAFTMLDMFHTCFSRERVAALQRVELLDEMEEFNLLLRHYCVVIATQDRDRDGDRDRDRDGDGDDGIELNVAKMIETMRTFQ